MTASFLPRARTVAALLIAPTAAAALVTLGLALYLSRGPEATVVWERDGGALEFVFWALWIVSLLSTVTLGAAVHAILYGRGIRNAGAYLAAGVIASALIATPLILTLSPYPNIMVNMLTVAVPCGSFTALFAWLIRRPDRDAPNPPTSTS